MTARKPTRKKTTRVRAPVAAQKRTRVRGGVELPADRIALLAAQAGLDKKAGEVVILDVRGKIDYADFLVLMSGQSDRHVAAIAHGVDGFLHEQGVRSLSVEGLPAGMWVLIDFVDVVVHVFHEAQRGLYDLDGLWLDAQRLPLPEQPAPAVEGAAPAAGAAARAPAAPAPRGRA